MDGDKHCTGTFRRTWISMCGLLLLLISSAGAISLSGSLEYGVPGDKFNLICDVPEEANWVSFYRSPEQHVGTVLVSNLSNVSECHFRNGTAANTTPCSSELCTCQPLDNTDLGRSFELVITPSDQDRNSSWLCTRYLQGSDNRSSALYILPVAKGPDSRLSLIPTDTSYTKFEGERLPDITCVADCTPGCSFVWEKSGIMITSRSVLSLETLDRSEAGQYTCIVSNIYGTGTAAVSVNVNYGPEGIRISTSDKDLVENQSVPDIDCNADCRPPCSYTWSKNGQIYPNPLSLSLATREKDGTYQCSASNLGRESVIEWTLTVRYPPDIVSLVYTQGNADVMENSAKSLTCDIESNPSSNITWYFNSNNVALKTTSNVRKSTYDLTSAKCLDTGAYTCSAWNSVSNAPVTRTLPINVLCKPRNDTRATTQSQSKIGIRLSEDLVITSVFLSNPEPTFSWQFHQSAMTEPLVNGENGVSISSSYNVTSLSTVSTLRRSSMREERLGIYIVTVTNSFGTDTRIFEVVPQDKPKPPFQGQAECLYSDRAMLSWTSNFNGGSEQTFVVGMRDDQQESFIINMDETYADPGRNKNVNAEISDLSPDRRYYFNVFAINGYGNSTLIEEINCTTKGVPINDVSPNAGAIAGAVVAAVILTACAIIAVFVFRKKIRTFFKKENDTEMTNATNRVNEYYNVTGEQGTTNQKVYDEVNYETREQPINEEVQECNSTYEHLGEQDKPSIYDDLQANQASGAQSEESPSKKRNAKPKSRSGRLSHFYQNVRFNKPKQDNEPTYVNTKPKAKKKKKNKN